MSMKRTLLRALVLLLLIVTGLYLIMAVMAYMSQSRLDRKSVV